MLLPPPKGKLDLTYSFVWVIILSNMITVAICFLFLKPLAKVTQVRGGIIIPLILVLIYLGAFAEKNAFQDMLVVLFFGGLGWAMEKMEWPRPPVLLGLVLGPLAENRLFLSTDNYGWAWTTRPGVIGIFILTLVGIFYPMFKSRREARKKAESVSGTEAAEALGSRGIHFGKPALFTLVVIVVLGLALWQSRNFGYRAGLFPWIIGTPTLILALAQLGRDLYGRTKKSSVIPGETAEAAAEIPPQLVRKRTLSILLWIIGFFVTIWLLGFSYAVPLTILLYLKLAGKEGWKITALITFFAWLFFWALFEKTLNVPFPEGLLFTLIKGGE
jgi:hypothetical protein